MKLLKTILQSNITYILLIIFLIIYLLIRTVLITYTSNLTGNSIDGIVTNLKVKDGYITFTLKATENVYATYYFNDEEDYSDLLGKKVSITGEFKNLEDNTIPNTFNFKKYLYNNYTYSKFKASSITILDNENIFYKIKNLITKRINSYSDTVKSYLSIFILGNKNYLDTEYYNIYQSNGIWHLFAISGMHISLIILILESLLKKIKFKNIIIMAFLSFFMFLTSFSASVMRSCIFYFLSTFLKRLDIKVSSIKVLLLTAFIILIINPFMIYNTGFQYSFIITFSIMLESSKVTGGKLMKIFKISLISFIVSLPISVNINYEVNLISVFLNILFVPFISYIVFPLSMLTFMFKFLNPVMTFVINILEISNTLISKLSINLVIPKMSHIIIILYYLVLLLFHKRKKVLLGLIIIIIVTNMIIPKLDSNYYVYFMDVGQGDSAVLISPHKSEVIMIDTGGSSYSTYHVSDNTILFLKSLGISTIDLLIITHGDVDHGGDATNILENINVSNIILNNGSINDLESEIISLGNVVTSYDSTYFDYFIINDYYSDDENYSSIITYFNIYGYSLLFMGDAPIEVEKLLISDYNLDIDILKVGHHGSKTSTSEEFIESIRPMYGVISVGSNNLYGHPHSSVLEVLKDTDIFRTDIEGTIEFKINKKGLSIFTNPP